MTFNSEKLTKKEFVEALPGTAFLAAVWDRSLEEILKGVESSKDPFKPGQEIWSWSGRTVRLR